MQSQQPNFNNDAGSKIDFHVVSVWYPAERPCSAPLRLVNTVGFQQLYRIHVSWWPTGVQQRKLLPARKVVWTLCFNIILWWTYDAIDAVCVRTPTVRRRHLFTLGDIPDIHHWVTPWVCDQGKALQSRQPVIRWYSMLPGLVMPRWDGRHASYGFIYR